MYIYNRLPIVAALLLFIVPSAGIQMTASLITRDQTSEQFENALEQAGGQMYHGRTVL